MKFVRTFSIEEMKKMLSKRSAAEFAASSSAEGKTALQKAFPLWQKAQTHVAMTLGPTRFERLLSDLKEVVALFR